MFFGGTTPCPRCFSPLRGEGSHGRILKVAPFEMVKDSGEMVEQGTSPRPSPHFAPPTPQNAEREKRSQRIAIASHSASAHAHIDARANEFNCIVPDYFFNGSPAARRKTVAGTGCLAIPGPLQEKFSAGVPCSLL